MLRRLVVQEPLLKSDLYSTRFKDGLIRIISFLVPSVRYNSCIHLNTVHPLENKLFRRIFPLELYRHKLGTDTFNRWEINFKTPLLSNYENPFISIHNGTCQLYIPFFENSDSDTDYNLPSDLEKLVDEFLKSYYLDSINIINDCKNTLISSTSKINIINGVPQTIKRKLFPNRTHEQFMYHCKNRLLNH